MPDDSTAPAFPPTTSLSGPQAPGTPYPVVDGTRIEHHLRDLRAAYDRGADDHEIAVIARRLAVALPARRVADTPPLDHDAARVIAGYGPRRPR